MIFLIVNLVIAKFSVTILNPNEKYTSTLNFTVAHYGNPFARCKYCQIYITDPKLCEVAIDLPSNTFVAHISDKNYCDLKNLAESVQNRGGFGLILINFENKNYSNYKISVNSFAQVLSTNLTIISIHSSQLNYNFFYQKSIIFNYDIIKYDNPILVFYLSNNYTMDKIFLSSILDLHQKYKFTSENFRIEFIYSENLKNNGYCIENDYKTYDIGITSQIMCYQLLQNSFRIVNYFNSLPARTPLLDFFQVLSSIYTLCEFDYSSSCLDLFFEKFPNPQNLSFENPLKTVETTFPHLKIGQNLIFSPIYLEKSWCLSHFNQPLMCPQELFEKTKRRLQQPEYCSPNCSYSDLNHGICSSSCTQSCLDKCNIEGCSISCISSIVENYCPGDCLPSCHAFCAFALICNKTCSIEYNQQGTCPFYCEASCCSDYSVITFNKGFIGLFVAVFIIGTM